MNNIDETRRRLAELIETNRALADDLDLCRRIAATSARERDALRQKVGQLQEEQRQTARMVERLRKQNMLNRARSNGVHRAEAVDRMRHERELLLQDAVAMRAEAKVAAQRIDALTVELQGVSRERDEISHQLADALAALADIRSNLRQDLGLSSTPSLGDPGVSVEEYWVD